MDDLPAEGKPEIGNPYMGMLHPFRGGVAIFLQVPFLEGTFMLWILVVIHDGIRHVYEGPCKRFDLLRR